MFASGRFRVSFSHLCFIGALLLAAPKAHAQFHLIPGLDLVMQQASLWCWAGSDKMVQNYMGNGSNQQCDDANFAMIVSKCGGGWSVDCCASPIPAACNVPCFPQVGFYYPTVITSAPPWSTIYADITANHAMVSMWLLDGGGQHFRVIHGYWGGPTTSDWNVVYLHDPLHGTSGQWWGNFKNSQSTTWSVR